MNPSLLWLNWFYYELNFEHVIYKANIDMKVEVGNQRERKFLENFGNSLFPIILPSKVAENVHFLEFPVIFQKIPLSLISYLNMKVLLGGKGTKDDPYPSKAKITRARMILEDNIYWHASQN